MDNRNMFFECESKIIIRIANKVFNNADVQDLRQEVFIRFAHSLKSIKNTDNLCGYLLRITDNIVNDFYRKKYKSPSDNFIEIETVKNVVEETEADYSFSLAGVWFSNARYYRSVCL